jgi:Fe-S cluster biogenesis protein NfuA
MPNGVESAQPLADQDRLAERVRAVLEQIRPAVKADGGDVEFIDIVNDTAQVRFHGACVGCPSSNLTLQFGIERAVKAQVPEIKKVVAVS